MPEPTPSSSTTYGFITVVEIPALGHCGGLLVVSQIGRPIEFHCTAPVATNRAQEILYGQTYAAYLYSDQIGMALVDKTKQSPNVFVSDCPELLPITELIDTPLILAENRTSKEPFDGRGLKQFSVNDQPVYCINVKTDQVNIIEQCTRDFVKTLPLDEPFERIRQAIEEAHGVVRAA